MIIISVGHGRYRRSFVMVMVAGGGRRGRSMSMEMSGRWEGDAPADAEASHFSFGYYRIPKRRQHARPLVLCWVGGSASIVARTNERPIARGRTCHLPHTTNNLNFNFIYSRLSVRTQNTPPLSVRRRAVYAHHTHETPLCLNYVSSIAFSINDQCRRINQQCHEESGRIKTDRAGDNTIKQTGASQ